MSTVDLSGTVSTCSATAQRCAFSDDLREIHFAADFIFEIELFWPTSLSALESPQGTPFSTAMEPDLRFGQKLDIVAGETQRPDI